MMKTIATAPNAHAPGYAIAFKLLLLGVPILLFICCNIALAQENASAYKNAVQKTIAEEKASPASDKPAKSQEATEDKTFSVTPYRPNYFLGTTYNDNPHEKVYTDAGKDVPNKYEAKFQLSIKILLKKNLFRSKGDLYAAYTQRSWWQIYQTSAPFRETNYEPEMFLRFNTDIPLVSGLRNKYFLFGFAHQSNGQGGELSRSWNRVYIEFIAKTDNLMLGLKPWYRIPENDETDDNPDIDKYVGYGKLYGAYQLKKFVFSFAYQNNLRFDENRGGLELGVSYELMDNLRLYLQYYNGYGESLIDYNNFTNQVGLGLMINDWL